MTDLQATLDAIDTLAVHQCAWCSKPLAEDGPSADFCEDYCQAAWLANRHEVVELVGYREPYDLPEYQGNQVELYSPEVTPPMQGLVWDGPSVTYRLEFDTAPMVAAFDELAQAMADMRERVLEGWSRIWTDMLLHGESYSLVHRPGNGAHFTIIDEVGHWRPRGILNAPGMQIATAAAPVPDGEPFDPDYEYDWRPVPGLHDTEPLLPVMPAVERDWQALANASRSPVSFAPPPQGAPRRNRRLR